MCERSVFYRPKLLVTLSHVLPHKWRLAHCSTTTSYLICKRSLRPCCNCIMFFRMSIVPSPILKCGVVFLTSFITLVPDGQHYADPPCVLKCELTLTMIQEGPWCGHSMFQTCQEGNDNMVPEEIKNPMLLKSFEALDFSLRRGSTSQLYRQLHMAVLKCKVATVTIIARCLELKIYNELTHENLKRVPWKLITQTNEKHDIKY